MDILYLYVLLISFIATVVRSTFGFGESLVAVPLFIFFLPIEVAVPLSVLISILVALIVVVQDHKQIHFNSAKWLLLYAILGIPIGLMILVYGNEFWINIGLGLLIIFYSLYALYGKNSIHLPQDNTFWLFVCGFLSGVFGGAYGLNGPPLVVYGNMRKWGAKTFRATLQAYFLPASFVGFIGYALKDLLTTEVWIYFLVSLPGVVPAVFIGRFLNHRLKGDSFYNYVYWALVFIGVLLIVHTLR